MRIKQLIEKMNTLAKHILSVDETREDDEMNFRYDCKLASQHYWRN